MYLVILVCFINQTNNDGFGLKVGGSNSGDNILQLMKEDGTIML